jgi:hypothetical protein
MFSVRLIELLIGHLRIIIIIITITIIIIILISDYFALVV